MAERNLLEKYAREDAQRFPPVPRTPAGLRSNVAEGGGHDPHTRSGCLWFSRPRRAHARFTFQCWRRRQDSNLHNPKVIAGFKPAQHASCAPPKVAERRVLETHTVAGALRLAIACEPCPLCAPKLVPPVDWVPTTDRVKAECS